MNNNTEELLSKCKTTSEKDTAEFFLRIGLKCIDINFIILDEDDKTHITDIDGIFLDEENEIIIIYDDSEQKEAHNQKISTFFSKCQMPVYEKQIYDKHKELPLHPIYTIYIDKNRNSKANINSIKHQMNENCKIIFNDDFEYFNEISKTIKKWTRNDLYNFLDIYPPNNRIQLDAIKIFIGDNPAYIYVDKPTDILKYSYVSRRRDNDHGYQRMIDFDRIKKISELIIEQKVSGFPNSLLLNSTVSIEETPTVSKSHCPKPVKITLPDHYSSCRIVDGQHRLISFALLNDIQRSHYMMSVVLMNKLNVEEEKKMFLDINTNAKSVDPNLEYDLISELSIWNKNSKEARIKDAVLICRRLEQSVLKGKIYKGLVDDDKKDRITLKGFADSLISSKAFDADHNLFTSADEIVEAIKTIIIEANKDNNKNYFLSNRGIDLLFNFWFLTYFTNQGPQIPFEAFFNMHKKDFFQIVKEKISELKKNYGDSGATITLNDTIELFISKSQIAESTITCSKNHDNITDIIIELSQSQSGAGRHKCAGCAYEEGFRLGLEGKTKEPFNKVAELILFNQSGVFRHKNVREAYDIGFKKGKEKSKEQNDI